MDIELLNKIQSEYDLSGKIASISSLISEYGVLIDDVVIALTKQGRSDIVKSLITNMRVMDIDRIAKMIIESNRIELIKVLLLNELITSEDMLLIATSDRKISCVQEILRIKSDTDLTESIDMSIKLNYEDVFSVLLNSSTDKELSKASESVGKYGRVWALSILIDKGLLNVDRMIDSALENKHESLVMKFMSDEKNVFNLNVGHILESAARYGNRDIIDKILQRNPLIDLTITIKLLTVFNHKSIVDRLSGHDNVKRMILNFKRGEAIVYYSTFVDVAEVYGEVGNMYSNIVMRDINNHDTKDHNLQNSIPYVYLEHQEDKEDIVNALIDIYSEVKMYNDREFSEKNIVWIDKKTPSPYGDELRLISLDKSVTNKLSERFDNVGIDDKFIADLIVKSKNNKEALDVLCMMVNIVTDTIENRYNIITGVENDSGTVSIAYNHTFRLGTSLTLKYTFKHGSLTHDYFVGTYLINDLCREIPNFILTLGLFYRPFPYLYDPEEKNVDGSKVSFHNPSSPIEFIIQEQVHGISMYQFTENYINGKVNDQDYITAVIQVFLALDMAYRRFDFTHMDMRWNNVLIEDMSPITIKYHNYTLTNVRYIARIINYESCHFVYKDTHYSIVDSKTSNPLIDISKFFNSYKGIPLNNKESNHSMIMSGIISTLNNKFMGVIEIKDPINNDVLSKIAPRHNYDTVVVNVIHSVFDSLKIEWPNNIHYGMIHEEKKDIAIPIDTKEQLLNDGEKYIYETVYDIYESHLSGEDINEYVDTSVEQCLTILDKDEKNIIERMYDVSQLYKSGNIDIINNMLYSTVTLYNKTIAVMQMYYDFSNLSKTKYDSHNIEKVIILIKRFYNFITDVIKYLKGGLWQDINKDMSIYIPQLTHLSKYFINE